MKKIAITFLTIFLFINSVKINSQIKNGSITYVKESIVNDQEKEKFKKHPNYEKFNKIDEGIEEALKYMSFELKFNELSSIFKLNKSLTLEGAKYYKFALIPHGNSVFYTSKNTVLEQKQIFGETFIISKEKLKWQLINETKIIGNYTCYKAKAIIKKPYRGKEKEYIKTAWYCPQINAPYGPIGYSGLPGLILELNEGKFKYKTSKIVLNSKNTYEIIKPEKGKKVTEQQMNTMISEAMGNFKRNKGY